MKCELCKTKIKQNEEYYNVGDNQCSGNICCECCEKNISLYLENGNYVDKYINDDEEE